MAGYNRNSPNPFVDGAVIEANDFDTEFGNLDIAFGTSGHNHNGTDGNGPKITTSGLADDAVTGAKIDSTTTVTAASFVGPLTGNVTGNLDANSATIDSLTITSGTAVTSIDTDLSAVSATDNTLASAKAIKTYVDAQVTASDLDFQGDSGGALSIDLDSETLTIAGGTGLSTTGSGNTLTVDIDSTVATLTGSQTLTNKTIASPVITGNLTTNGNIDGRDVATDGTKLDGIETGATADQTAAEIRSLVESATDSNVFTDADHTKLDGIETGATADQTAAEIRTLVGSATDSNVFTDADHTKLDGIEASADVTDSTNVQAAGALMDSEVTNLAQVKAFSSADYATAAQGTLADSAVQPADNISVLTNNSGYITGNQTITLSGDATGSGTTAITVALAENTVGVNELNLSEGSAGQFLTTNGAGTISFADAPAQGTTFSTIDVNGGSIDGVTIGTNSVVTDLRVDNLKLDGNTISATNTNGGINLTADGNGEFTITSGVNLWPRINIVNPDTEGSPGIAYTIHQTKIISDDVDSVPTEFVVITASGDPAASSEGKYLIEVARNGFQGGLATSLLIDGVNEEVLLRNANLKLASSGTGIDFSFASGAASGMTDELLDDYEEGTWTPILTTTGSDFASVSHSASRSGTYTKIGRQVTVHCFLAWNSIVFGTASGSLAVGGLPFTKGSTVTQLGPAYSYLRVSSPFNNATLAGALNGSNKAVLYKNDQSNEFGVDSITPNTIDSGSTLKNLQMTLTYEV